MIRYALAHMRIRASKPGVCCRANCSRTDVEVALIHGRGTHADETGVHAGVPYSTDPADYMVLCRSHHRTYDLSTDTPAARQLVTARAAIGQTACERCGRVVRTNCLPMHLRHCGREGPRCTFDGCSEPAKARGYCNTHYERWRRHGNPAAVHWRNATGEGTLPARSVTDAQPEGGTPNA